LVKFDEVKLYEEIFVVEKETKFFKNKVPMWRAPKLFKRPKGGSLNENNERRKELEHLP
jgi:hypothetical protein